MGKSRVKGITVQIGGDTGPLTSALKGVDDQIYKTQSQLKDVNRLLKLDPKNTVLLQQKQKLLAQEIEATTSRLNSLNDVLSDKSKVADNFDAMTEALEPVQQEISETTEKLKKLTKQRDELAAEGKVDTDTYKKLTEEVTNTENALKELKEKAKAVRDEFGNPLSPEQYDALQREIIETEQNLEGLQAQADKTFAAMDEKAMAAKEAMEKLGDTAANVKDKAKKVADVFSPVTKGVAALTTAVTALPAATSDYRQGMASLEASSASAGYTAEETEEAYMRLYGILADSQSSRTTVANLQALNLEQDQLLSVINNCIGAWAKYGDSIPIDGLAEAINETAKTGKITGVLADVYNWGADAGEAYGQALKDLTKLQEAYDAAVEHGKPIRETDIWLYQQMAGVGNVWDESLEDIEDEQERNLAKLEAMIKAGEDWNDTVTSAETAEDKFNLALEQCNSEEERLQLILESLNDQGLSELADNWRNNNAEMIRANEANAVLQESLAELAETVLPLMTTVTEKLTDFLEWFNALPGGTQAAIAGLVLFVGAISPVASVVSGAAGLVESLSKVSLPGLGGALDKIAGAHLPSLSGAFSSVFGFIAANPVVLLIGAIVGLVALVATKSEDCIEWLNMIDDFLQNVFAVDWTEIFGPVLGGALNDFFALCKEVWDGAKLMLEGIIDFIAGVFSGDWERAWEGVKKIFTGIFDSLEGLLKAPINGVIRMVNKSIDGVNWLIDGVNHIPGVNIGTIGQIPMLANGGEVLRGNAIVGEGGPELLTVLQDRTVVQPLTNNYHNTTRNLGGVTMNVYGAPGQDVRELTEAVAEEMQYLYESEEAAIG